MYRIEKAPYGFHLTFGGVIGAPEMKQWFDESRKVLQDAPAEFCVFVDMRTLVPLEAEAREIIEEGQRFYQQCGMQRSVVILNSPVTRIQFQSIAGESGIHHWERYISAASEPNWEQIALDWIERGIDPEKRPQCKSAR